MARIGIHATRKQREARIQEQGLRSMPFWRSRRPLRRPKEFRFRYPSHANVLSGKTPEEIFQSVYDALRVANTPHIGTAKKRFNLRNTRIFLVDLEKSKVTGKKERLFVVETSKSKKPGPEEGLIEEAQLEHAPSKALKQFQLAEKEIAQLEKETEKMNWFEANKRMARSIAEKIMKKLA